MKRLLAMLLAVAMLAALLCGCASGGTTEPTEVKETKGNAETEAATEENVTEAQKPAIATGTPQEIVESLIGDSLDLSIYEVETDEDSITYSKKDQYASFPYAITLYGMDLQLDGVSTYQDVLDGGWTFNMPETADASHYYLNSVRGSDGNYLSISLVNLKDEAIAIEEAYLYRVNGDIENGATFSFGTITESSSLADAIQAFGAPYRLHYTKNSGLLVQFQDDDVPSGFYRNEASFHFDTDGIITEVELEYDYHNLI